MIPVPYIEYLNVRIRGYHSRLFTRDVYEDLIASDNLDALTTYLLNNSRYAGDIDSALVGQSERRGLEQGVSDHFARSVSNILAMAQGRARQLFETALNSFDIMNLRAVILAYARGLPFQNVRPMIMSFGSLNDDDYAAMYDARDLTEFVHFAVKRYPLGGEALSGILTATEEKTPLVSVLNCLEQDVYDHRLRHLDHKNTDEWVLREIYRCEIDMKNIVAALKMVWNGTVDTNESGCRFIVGGTIQVRFLEDMARSASVDEALEMIEETPFHPAVEKGIIYFAETGFLHEMERFFEEVFIRKTQSFRRYHPFGIGVFVGYVWGQFVEMTNLRTIINGIAFRMGAGQMRKGLIYV